MILAGSIALFFGDRQIPVRGGIVLKIFDGWPHPEGEGSDCLIISRPSDAGNDTFTNVFVGSANPTDCHESSETRLMVVASIPRPLLRGEDIHAPNVDRSIAVHE
jgi:hypothetical protein